MAGTLDNFSVLPNNGSIIHGPRYVDHIVLAAGVAKSLAIPASATMALFNGTDNFYVAYTPTGNSTVNAVVPSVDVTDGTGNELNPRQRYLGGYDHLSFISPNACTVTIAFYQA